MGDRIFRQSRLSTSSLATCHICGGMPKGISVEVLDPQLIHDPCVYIYIIICIYIYLSLYVCVRVVAKIGHDVRSGACCAEVFQFQVGQVWPPC